MSKRTASSISTPSISASPTFASKKPKKEKEKPKKEKEKPIAFLCCLHGNLDYAMGSYFPNLEEHNTRLKEAGMSIKIPTISNNAAPFYHPGNEEGVTPMCPTDYFSQVPDNITVVDMSLPDESVLVNWPVEHYMLEILEKNTELIQKYIEKEIEIPNSRRGDGIDIAHTTNLLFCNAKIYYPKQTIPNILLTTDKSEGLYNARIIDGEITVSPQGHGKEYTNSSGTSEKLPSTIRNQYEGKTDDLFDKLNTHESFKNILLSSYFLHLKHIYGNKPIVIYLLNCKPLPELDSQQTFFTTPFFGVSDWDTYLTMYDKTKDNKTKDNKTKDDKTKDDKLLYKYLIDCQKICENSIKLLVNIQQLYDNRTVKIIKARNALKQISTDKKVALYCPIGPPGFRNKERVEAKEFFQNMKIIIDDKISTLKKIYQNNDVLSGIKIVSPPQCLYTELGRWLGLGGKKKSKRKAKNKRRKTRKHKSKP